MSIVPNRQGDRPESADGEPSDPAPDSEVSPGGRARPPFAVFLIAALGLWKLYEAFTADTLRATVPPSLSVLGLVGLAVSLRGPRSLRLVSFFAGALLCLAALASDIRF